MLQNQIIANDVIKQATLPLLDYQILVLPCVFLFIVHKLCLSIKSISDVMVFMLHYHCNM